MLLIILISIFYGFYRFVKWAKKLDEDSKAYKNTEIELTEKLRENNIVATHRLYLATNPEFYQMLIIDDTNKRLTYLTKDKVGSNTGHIDIQYFKYSDVLKCELINHTRTESVEVYGSIRDRKKNEIFNIKQGFRISLNDLSNPLIEMIFLNERRGTKISYMDNIEEWIAKIDIVIAKGKIRE